jgi:hypothetical protein
VHGRVLGRCGRLPVGGDVAHGVEVVAAEREPFAEAWQLRVEAVQVGGVVDDL